MRTPFHPLVVCGALMAVAVAFASCEGGAEEEPAPADTAAMEETAEPEGMAGVAPSEATVSQLTVTNPMPHAMVVTVAYAGGGSTELGTVPASGEQSFAVAASPGETVTVSARDMDETHTVEATVVLEQENRWTIQ